MMSQELTNEARKPAIEKAKSSIRRDPHAGFEDQAPYLRLLLENLPILQPGAPALQAFPMDRAAQWNADSVMEYLERWPCYHPPGSHDGAIHVQIEDEPNLLIITFHFFYGVEPPKYRESLSPVSMLIRFCVGLASSPKGTRLLSTTTEVKPRVGLPGLCDRVLEWFESRDWARDIIKTIACAIVYGIGGAIAGAIFGIIWGATEWGTAEAVFVMVSAMAMLFGAGGIIIGIVARVIKVIEERQK